MKISIDHDEDLKTQFIYMYYSYTFIWVWNLVLNPPKINKQTKKHPKESQHTQVIKKQQTHLNFMVCLNYFLLIELKLLISFVTSFCEYNYSA